jgi:hypothetical protein
LTFNTIAAGASSLMASFVRHFRWNRDQPSQAIGDLGGEDIALLGAGTRAADRRRERLLGGLNLCRVVNPLERGPVLLQPLVELHVLVDALLEVLQHERFGVDPRTIRLGLLHANSCRRHSTTQYKSCSHAGHPTPNVLDAHRRPARRCATWDCLPA